MLQRLPRASLLLLVLSAYATGACTNEGISAGVDVPALAPVGIVGDSSTFVLPTAMKVFGDRLLVASARDSFALRVIDLASGKVVARAAPVGDTVGTLRSVWYLFPESYDRPAAWVYDVLRGQLTLWSIESARLQEVKRVRPRMRMAAAARPLLTSKGMVVDAVYRGATLAIGQATADSADQLFGTPPFKRSDFQDSTAHITANDLFPISDPSRRRLALFYKHVTRVDFFDIENGSLRTSEGPGDMPSLRHKEKLTWDELPDTHVNGQDATTRYVYSVYCGCTSAQRNKGRRGMIVRVFDWDGKFVGDVQLDRHVTAIAVTPNDSLLYGAMQDPAPMIGKWILPASLRQGGATSGTASAKP